LEGYYFHLIRSENNKTLGDGLQIRDNTKILVTGRNPATKDQ